MLGYFIIGAAMGATLFAYLATLLALVYAVIIRDPDPGDRARLVIVALVMLVAGITLHASINALAGYVL